MPGDKQTEGYATVILCINSEINMSSQTSIDDLTVIFVFKLSFCMYFLGSKVRMSIKYGIMFQLDGQKEKTIYDKLIIAECKKISHCMVLQ